MFFTGSFALLAIVWLANGIVIHRDDFRFACDSYTQTNSFEEALDQVNTRFARKNIMREILDDEKDTLEYIFEQALAKPLLRDGTSTASTQGMGATVLMPFTTLWTASTAPVIAFGTTSTTATSNATQSTLAGPPGATGAPGVEGPAGAAGPPGPQGKPGKPGKPGKYGKPGKPGRPGFNGTPGEEGPSGANGSEGPPGANGSEGPPGANGSTGPPGPSGMLSTNLFSGGSKREFEFSCQELNYPPMLNTQDQYQTAEFELNMAIQREEAVIQYLRQAHEELVSYM